MHPLVPTFPHSHGYSIALWSMLVHRYTAVLPTVLKADVSDAVTLPWPSQWSLGFCPLKPGVALYCRVGITAAGQSHRAAHHYLPKRIDWHRCVLWSIWRQRKVKNNNFILQYSFLYLGNNERCLVYTNLSKSVPKKLMTNIVNDSFIVCDCDFKVLTLDINRQRWGVDWFISGQGLTVVVSTVCCADIGDGHHLSLITSRGASSLVPGVALHWSVGSTTAE